MLMSRHQNAGQDHRESVLQKRSRRWIFRNAYVVHTYCDGTRYIIVRKVKGRLSLGFAFYHFLHRSMYEGESNENLKYVLSRNLLNTKGKMTRYMYFVNNKTDISNDVY